MPLNDPMIVKTGPKGRHLRIPEGWHRIRKGPVHPRDRFANLGTYGWSEVDAEDIAAMTAEDFYCLIRQGS